MKSFTQLLSKHNSKIIVLWIILAICIRLVYLSYTTYNQRGYDAEDHFTYIKYIAENLRLPPPDQGWEYHQPPLYYITAAIIYKLSTNKIKSLQILSLGYSIIFLIVGTALLQQLLKNKLLFYSMSLLFLMWPSNIIHSVRIGNDPMYYMMNIITLYFLIKWCLSTKSTYFYLTVFFTALTLSIKFNGIIMVILVALALLYKWLKSKKSKIYLKPTLFLILIIMLTFSLSFYRNVQITISHKNFNLINGNTYQSMNKMLSINNSFSSYILFNENLFLSQTFTTPWEDKGGRQYFWNYLAKTILFGEFSYSYPFKTIFATIIDIITTGMAVFLTIGVAYTLRRINLTRSILLTYLLFSLTSLIYYRYRFSFSSNEDFRFIFPALLPGIYLYATGIEYTIKNNLKILEILAYILAFILIICSSLFFISPLIP